MNGIRIDTDQYYELKRGESGSDRLPSERCFHTPACGLGSPDERSIRISYLWDWDRNGWMVAGACEDCGRIFSVFVPYEEDITA
jgi:hypothetical protein